ncbi:sulfurtransferase complex subunit TusD [Neptunomonas japonica]|uniref:tRNA 2-thiouridine synthesizing protein D n=1 Tax=Neptunomonas japonica JAMM 1380 TaxID=1441457 RepID=A0A7R6SVE1_9GAMM|nr:sulfurtransferase complex subunit TusD [Neptunomonas japonica]BBB29320.1 tRNA 2-thiouridine synthesizing protein D [Neptunomonas japonica JAMM 1380]
MLFSILIYGSAHNSQSAHTAYRFADSALKAGHQIHRIFFYGESVHTASMLSAPPRDEQNIHQLWKELAQAHKLDLVVCIAAALKRGVMDEAEAKRHEKSSFNSQAPYELSGLGQLSEAAITSDRLVTFGA